MTRPLISYVFPIYNEEGNIELLYDEVVATLQPERFDYEFVFVNDGSRDGSLRLLTALSERDDRVRVLDFSRNFGHQLAVTAGLTESTGDAVIIMDSDLQDPPAVANELIARWEEGFDVAYAQRRSRKDTLFKRVTAHVYYWLLQLLTDIAIPRNTGDFRLISRQVVDELLRFREQNRFLRGLVTYVGFRQVAVPFDRDARHAGVTGYPFRKMISFALDGVMSFSAVPLRLITHVGYALSALALVGVIAAIVTRVVAPQAPVEGWTFTIVAILLIGGMNMVTLGVVGAYVGRIYSEAQDRPLYIVRSTIRGGEADQGGSRHR